MASPALLRPERGPTCVASPVAGGRPGWLAWLPAIVVVGAGMLAAGLAYGRLLDDPRHLWTCAPHDRNAHYLFALNIALDLRSANVVGLLHEIDGARVWGPLHGLADGLILAIAGPDYRLAVLPSLLAWIGTALLVFLIARRAVPRDGNRAGFAGAVFVLASPAYQAFATDIMLESLGACLTLAVLYCYLRTVQDRTPGAARGLALALTALFLLKYNYWLLAVIPLAAAAALALGRPGWERVGRACAGLSGRRWLRVQVRSPLTWLLVAVLMVLLVMVVWPGGSAGSKKGLRSHDNLVHLAYVAVFLRLLPWWWRQGRQWARTLPYPAPQLAAWHAVPVALWFLWPKRPSYFFWYLTRNHGGEVAQHDLGAAASFYWNCLASEYHLGLASLLVVVALLGIALVSWRRLRPGGALILAFVLVAAFLAVRYPSHRSRFLHSWVAVGWAGAGIGLSQLASSRWASALGKWTPRLALSATAILAAAHLPGMVSPGRAPEGGLRPTVPSNLDVTDSYLPALADARWPVVLSNAPIKQLAGWTYLDHFGRRAPVKVDLPVRASGPAFDEAFAQWLRQGRTDAIVFISAPPGTLLFQPPARPGFERIPDVLAAQPDFRLAGRQDLPEQGCTVMIWRRERLAARGALPAP